MATEPPATVRGTPLTTTNNNSINQPYGTSDKWSRKVSIDSSFLDILTSRTNATPNTRSGKTPSLSEAAAGLTIGSNNNNNNISSKLRSSKGKWKAGLLVTGRMAAGRSPASLSQGQGQGQASEVRGYSRERRGTVPAGLHLADSRSKRHLGITGDAVFAGGRFRTLLSRRRTSSQGSHERGSRPGSPGAAGSPESPRKSFKDLARQALFQRRVSEGNEPGRTPSLGDVFMQELYKQVDRKKLAKLRHIAEVQAAINEKRRLLKKFKMAVLITVWCIKTCRRHCVRAQEANDLSSFFNMNFAAMDTFEDVDLLFDPSKFKANRLARISKEMKRVLRKLPQDRTPQELYYVQIALRNIKVFSEFPDRMQRKIAEVGMYEKYDARRVLLRQGHPAHSFYFILSGAVSVLVLEEGRSFAKVMAHLEKGQSFGELAIITRGMRQSNVVVKEKSEFLTISVDDYHRIFMSGGVKSVNDPDHEMFVKSLPFLQGWPIHKLQEDGNKCVFLYFKRGDVIVKDSKYSDWIIVVKSGSLAVLKKLRKVEPYEWRKPKVFTFVSDKEKRERQDRLSMLRKQALPELHVPLKASHTRTGEDEQIREEGRLRPFVHPDCFGPAVVVSEGGCDAKVWDLGTTGFSGSALDSMTYVHVPRDATSRQGEGRHAHKKDASFIEDARPRTVGSGQSESLLPGRNKSKSEGRGRSSMTSSPVEMISDLRKSDENFKSEVRTIQQELEECGIQKDPDDITAADLNPEFVHVQTLTKGMCFGLSDLILGQNTSLCVVSNGADVILVNKQLYFEHASEGLLRRMRQDLCPYPTEEELQMRLQTSVDWDAYRQTTLADTLKSMRMRKEVRT